jgi:hypothetical protein
MAKGAKLFEVVYVDNQDRVPVLVGIGDTIRATDWAEKEYPFPPKPDLHEGLSLAECDFNREVYRDAKFAVDKTREFRSGLYAVYLGAERGKLRGTEEGWLGWLSSVTMPDDDDDDEAEAPAEGESQGPSSEA